MKSETRGLGRWPRRAVVVAAVWGASAVAFAAPVEPKPVQPKPVTPTPVQPKTATPAKPAPAPAKPAPAPTPAPSTTRAKVEAKGGGAGKPPPPPPAGGTAPSADDPLVAGTTNTRQSEIYGDRLDVLQADVDELKQKIFRSKTRLGLLKETVLRGVMAGSRIIVAHRNLMGSGFRLVRVVYILDGAQIYARTDETGTLDSEDEVVIFDGNLPPGPHNVTVELTYQGHGFGVFSYLSGYTFESRSSHSFDAPENSALKLASIGFERGNITTEMKNRPSVSWQEVPLDASGRPLPGAGSKKSKK